MTSNDNSPSYTGPLQNIGDLWNVFSQNTGFHGVNKLSGNTSRTKIRMLLWICVILSCGIYLTVTVVQEIKLYYSYPTTMTQYTKPQNEIEFPTVTVCNLNSLNKSAISNDSRIENYYSSVSLVSVHFPSKPINWSDPIFEQEGFYLNRTLEDVMIDQKKVLDPGGLLVSANFDFSPLDVKKYFQIKLYPNRACFTSNPNMKIKSKHEGSEFHMTLMLDLDTANNYYGTTYGEGLQFIVHDANEDPIHQGINGFYVRPGRDVFASVHKKRYEYLPKPYEAMENMYCKDQKNDDGSKYYRTCEYIIQGLFKTVIQYVHFVVDEYYCSKFEVANCTTKAIGDFYKQAKLACDCPLPCTFTQYEVSLTSSLFPSDFYSKKAFDVRGEEHLDYYRQNYVNLHIYFDQLSTTISQQVPKYSSAGDIFANLGGQMGLFLGASIVTLTELCEFLIFAFLTFIINVIKRGQTKVQTISIQQ
ncbi:acid-sensing ion channel 4-B-like [Mytilus trossulus]|uniref:acid-sensing ion channel 4-B-like n=1 Tax=Mytilus trossulus TaxID=6551 RepID=UPI003004AA15